jgi:hypothetical protein
VVYGTQTGAAVVLIGGFVVVGTKVVGTEVGAGVSSGGTNVPKEADTLYGNEVRSFNSE